MNDKQSAERLKGKNLWTVARADREMRADLLHQTRLLAQSLNVEPVQALTGTEADMKNPEYLRLKEQLATVRSANPQYRFIYLMGRKFGRPAATAEQAGGAVFFFVDSEPAGSKDYSPPGRVYEEVPENYRRVFDTRAEAVEGPVSERRGTWVSTLVPINDPQTAIHGLATQDDAREMVRKAVDFYRKNGRERLLKEINNPQGEFCKGDL